MNGELFDGVLYMANKCLKLLKVISACIAAIGAIAGITAFVMERFEKKSQKHRSYGIYETFIKRPLDASLSTVALIVLSPVILVVAILVRVHLGAPIVFRQERPGRDGNIFTIYKFRTMLQPQDGQIDSSKDGQRLTPFGESLRKTSLDELLELINIIKGDMALVGPRPLLTQYLARYNEHQARRHEVRPGITGLAQVHGRNAISWDEKFEWDVKYVDNITFINDLKIFAETIRVVICREGISAVGEATMSEFMGNAKGNT